jgi:hypothetical protein
LFIAFDILLEFFSLANKVVFTVRGNHTDKTGGKTFVSVVHIWRTIAGEVMPRSKQ